MLVRAEGHIIGNIENGVFVKQVDGSRHFLRTPEPAIGLDAVAYDSVISKHARRIEVIDRESRAHYHINLGVFDGNKKVLDRGFGKQYFVPLRLWTSGTMPQGRLL